MGSIVGAQDISFPAMREKLSAFIGIVRADPAVDNVVGFTGGGSVNTGRVFAQLKDLGERKGVSADQVISRLRGRLARIPGATLYLQAVQDIRVGGRGSNSQYQYTLRADSLAGLNYWSQRLLDKIRLLPGIRDANSDQQNQGQEAQLVIDRDSASRLGLSAQAIDEALYDSFGQRNASTMYTALNQYFVVMEVDPRFQKDPSALRSLYVVNSSGAAVPLSAVARLERTSATLAVNHQGQFPSTTLSFNLAPGVALGDAVDAIGAAEHEIGMPGSVQGSFTGTAQAFQSSLANQPWLILAAFVTVYIVLGILYESYIHPITILSTLPFGWSGRAAGAVDYRRGPERDRAHRNHPADRDREEETPL